VTVADLQAKSTPAEQASVSAIQARAAAEAYRPPTSQLDATTEPVRSEDIADEPRMSNRLAKTIGLTLIAVVACGAVTAVAALNGGRPHRMSPTTPVAHPTVLAGPALTRPDLIIQQLTSGTVDAASRRPFGSAQDHPPGDPVDDEVAGRTITDFYAYAGPLERRQRAFDLLAPTMRVDGWQAFDGAWRGTRVAEVSRWVSDGPDGALRVWVSIEQLDGTLLRLVQRMYVRAVRIDGTVQPRIAGVELLSAHRG